MRFILLILLWLGVAFAANPPTISAILTSDITHSSARITWTTDTSSTTKIEFGLTASYGTTNTGASSVTSHAYFVSGLVVNTLYHYKVCSTDSTEACSADQTFTTAALPSPHPQPPFPPAPVDSAILAPPTIDGTTFNVASDCSDLQTQLDAAAAADGALSHDIIIPAGTLCNGQYTLPNKSGSNPTGSGILWLRSDSTTLPPVGTRLYLAESTTGKLAVIRTNFIGMNEGVSTSLPGTCNSGDLLWGSDLANNGFIRRCGPANTWNVVAVVEQTTAPATCADGDWWYDTNGAGGSAARYYWCLGANNWVNVKFGNPGFVATHAALTVAASAHRWRVGPGIEITHVATAAPYATYFDASPSNQTGSWVGCLVEMPPTSHRIVLDRVLVRGRGYPSRLFYGICHWDASHAVIRDSYFDGMNHWVAAAASERSNAAINIQNSTGPGLVQNNYFDNPLGIALFANEDQGVGGSTPSDYTVKYNTFKLTGAAADPLGDGKRYYRRHLFELKRGRRWLIQGNTFDGGWFESAVGAGASIALTPRPGTGTTADNDVQVSDIDFRDNVIANTSEGLRIAGRHDGCCGQNAMTRSFSRLRLQNILFYGIDEARTTSGTGTGDNIVLVPLGIEDVIVEHTTTFNTLGLNNVADFFNIDASISRKSEGFLFRCNIHTHNYGPNGVGAGIRNGISTDGTGTLDNTFTGTFTWDVAYNIWMRPGGNPGTYPANNTWITALTSPGFVSTSATSGLREFGLNLASSYLRCEVDDSYYGIDAYKLEAELGGARQLRVVTVTDTTATVALLAPNSTACTIWRASDANFTSPTAFTATVLDNRRQTVSLTSLTPVTTYYIAALCVGDRATTSFSTRTP